MQRCFLDIDGVLADFDSGAHKALGLSFDKGHWPYTRGPGGWDWYEELGLSLEEFDSHLGFDFWANLEWMPDGHDILRTVLRFFSPKQITLLTTPMPNVMSASGKVAWVKEHLPAYDNSLMVITDSKSVLAQVPGAVLVDDCQKNVNQWRAAGGVAVLVPRPWNNMYAFAESAVEDVRIQLEALTCD